MEEQIVLLKFGLHHCWRLTKKEKNKEKPQINYSHDIFSEKMKKGKKKHFSQ